MPLTASGAAANDAQGPSVKTRVLAIMEGLILAGIIYLVTSVRGQELSMVRVEASTSATQQLASAIPALTIRVVEAEKDIAENKRDLVELKEEVKEVKSLQRLK